MREVKFRGKSKATGEWLYGYLTQHYSASSGYDELGYFISTVYDEHGAYDSLDSEVFPESIGQFTGLLDKNGKEIYEGDVDSEGIFIVWRKDLASFALRRKGWMYDHFFGEAKHPDKFEIIGNTYDNEGLLTLKSESCQKN